MFKFIILALVLAAVAFLAYVAAQPAEFRITRTRAVSASPEALFALINDLHGFNRWNPFALGDPALKIDYSGPQAGPGAAYIWDSTGKTGQGRLEITESSPSSQVAMRIDFRKPFQAHNEITFLIAPEGSSTTRVTWTMTGRNAFLNKLMGTIFNMDRMVGGEFDKGLANLKSIAERQG